MGWCCITNKRSIRSDETIISNKLQDMWGSYSDYITSIHKLSYLNNGKIVVGTYYKSYREQVAANVVHLNAYKIINLLSLLN